MASIILYHSVLGLRPVEKALAAEWRNAGHAVATPDLFDGRTAETYDGGFAILNDIGLKTVTERALAAADEQPDNLVLAGVSMGAGMASRAWSAKPGASGVLFIAGPAPWPEMVSGTPVQMHAARPEPFDGEEVFDEWRSENPGARLEEFRYDDVGHYFLDASLPDYSEAASKACRQRCLEFLATLQT
ncbi:dienelactone hydrolase family protein [Cognatiyoonia sp. IB215182]|uniref:dienelactone hydrolase family protein n=1 Tax=Cognatiyoonia sp. IB215182 TaxID=3097353 RepID=UPI002A0BB1A2|nr:dienelactone hydrolase family protein [Cognatiyoonia sp. IB215182]MDX8355591.1 dienelactone hydrolase family protein [Cognatiyoonia sp. IB215182]